jgi:polyisoprenoid-binding protein YceI
MIKKTLLSAIIFAVSGSALADWTLDNDFSRVNFVSVKKNMIGEAHRFKQVSGSLSDTGQLQINIALTSVETLIPIRNERLQKLLFETKLFPQAKLSADIDPKQLKLAAGQSKILDVNASLTLHGVTKKVTSQVMVSSLSKDKLLVSALKPIIIRPADFGLDKGVEALMKIANLPGITQSVPVSFVLTFAQ